jgi:hypothetical protein
MPRPATLILVSLSVCASAGGPAVLKPSCVTPAPLNGHFDSRAPGYLIQLKPGREDFTVLMSRLKTDYGIRTRAEWPRFRSFAADLDTEQVSELRCDQEVLELEYDAIATASSWQGRL